MVPTTLGRQTQPEMDLPARRGRSRSPMDMGSLMWETITTVGTPLMAPEGFGATLQTLTLEGTTALCPSVDQVRGSPRPGSQSLPEALKKF